MNFVLGFLKGFVIKFLTTKALEKVVVVLLKALVQRTESKVDDELFEAVFGKMEGVRHDGTYN